MHDTPSISVIFPYYNEERTLPQTLERIVSQTLMPLEVIFVHSPSTDQSEKIIQDWIQMNQSRYSTKFIDLEDSSFSPAEAKNVGIRNARGNYLAFMDCSLLFDEYWLEKQWKFIQANAVDMVTGQGYFEGENWIDRCAVSQTYGYKTFYSGGMTPTTLVRKNVFETTGLFANRRAGYDHAWRMRATALGIKSAINPEVVIRYSGINFAPDLKRVFKKCILYYSAGVNIPNYPNPYQYLAIALFGVLTVALKPSSLLFFIPAYWILRGYLIPYRKAGNLNIIRENWMTLFLLPIVGAVMDAGKIVGILKGVYLHHIRARAKT